MKKLIHAFFTFFFIVPFISTAQPDYDYVFTYFDGSQNNGLKLAGSNNGYSWTPIGGVNFSPRIGQWKIFLDPSFDKGPDGKFHLAWTTGSHGFGSLNLPI